MRAVFLAVLGLALVVSGDAVAAVDALSAPAASQRPQVEEGYCGPYSLWFALSRLGYQVSMFDVRSRFDGIEGGRIASLAELVRVAEQYDLYAYPLVMSSRELKKLAQLQDQMGPELQVILHVPKAWGHFVPVVWMDETTLQVFETNTFSSRLGSLESFSAEQAESVGVLVLSKRPLSRRVLAGLSGRRFYSRLSVAAVWALSGVIGAIAGVASGAARLRSEALGASPQADRGSAGVGTTSPT